MLEHLRPGDGVAGDRKTAALAAVNVVMRRMALALLRTHGRRAREDGGWTTSETDAAATGPLEADEVERLRRPSTRSEQRHLRLLADFDNLAAGRRASRRPRAAKGSARRCSPLLPVLDTLERALAAGSTDPDFYEGVAATHRLFIDGPARGGRRARSRASASRSTPNVHEAVATVPAESVEPGTVVREVRRGWRLGDELLRPAQVVVAAPREAAADPWR